jgi:hypothetical protein
MISKNLGRQRSGNVLNHQKEINIFSNEFSTMWIIPLALTIDLQFTNIRKVTGMIFSAKAVDSIAYLIIKGVKFGQTPVNA